jgi:hypothetical protein
MSTSQMTALFEETRKSMTAELFSDPDAHVWARGFLRNADDTADVFVSIDLVNFTEIIQVGPIVYDNGDIWNEAYTLIDDRKTAAALTVEAINWREYDVQF